MTGLPTDALRVAQHHDESCGEALRGELDAADLRRGDDVSGNADDKQVAQAAVEDDLRRHARIGTFENDGERLLAGGQLAAARPARECGAAPHAGCEATVALSEALQCVSR